MGKGVNKVPCDIGEIDTCMTVNIEGCKGCPHDLTPFNRECPHFESRQHIRDFNTCGSPPEDKHLHWCGDKAEWVLKCDEPCGRLEMFKNLWKQNELEEQATLAQQKIDEIKREQESLSKQQQDLENVYGEIEW